MKLPDFLSQDKYGFIHLTGHRVGLNHVLDVYRESGSVDAVSEQFPTLSRDEVAQVVEFYRRRQAEIDQLLACQRAEMERDASRDRTRPSPEELRRRKEARELADKAS